MRKDAVPGKASRADGAAEASGEQEPLATYEASVFFVRSDERIPERPSETRRREFCFFGGASLSQPSSGAAKTC